MKVCKTVICLVIVLSLGGLVACSTGTAEAPSTAPPALPTGPALPLPTEMPTPHASLAPTSVVPDNLSMLTYTHPSQRFSIDYPANWQPFERENGVVFIDPGAQAGYGVFFQDAAERYDAADLAQFATNFVLTNYGDDEAFRILERADGLMGASIIQFRSEDEVLGPSINEATVAQFGQTVYIVIVSAVEGQWFISAETLRQLTNSLQVSVDQPPETPSAEVAGPPELALYFHPSERFGFAYTNDWTLTEDESSVEVSLPASGFTFSAELIPHPGAGQDNAAALTDATTFVEDLTTQYPDLQSLPPAEFTLSSQPGITIDYLYSDETGTLWAGSIVVVGYKDELHRLILAAPAGLWEVALEWFNLMMQSYQILEDSPLSLTPSP